MKGKGKKYEKLITKYFQYIERSSILILNKKRTSLGVVDGVDDIHTRRHLAEDNVLGRGGAVKEIQEGVVLGVDEELRSAGLGLAGVGHGEGADLVTELGAVRLLELIGNASIAVTGDGATAGNLVGGARGGATGAGSLRVGVSGVGAAELVHEVGDHTVEVEAVVVASLSKVNEVVCAKRIEVKRMQEGQESFSVMQLYSILLQETYTR